MDQIRVHRDRLLARAARLYASAGLLTAVLVLSVTGPFDVLAYWASLPLIAVAFAAAASLGRRRPRVAAVVTAAATTAVAALIAAFPEGLGDARHPVMFALFGVVVPGAASSMLARRGGWVWFLALAVGSLGAAVAVALPDMRLPAMLVVALGSAVAFGSMVLLRSSIPIALRQVSEVGRARRVERQASQLEAQRRHSARLLHDTVLATLSLLAHGGRGVPFETLRAQARNDAQLLRQLRLGQPLVALPDAAYRPELVEESTLGTTLDSVKQRFERLGLDVDWHGSRRILLPPAVLDSFLAAIGECLENVRRHSGVQLAHVTITEDDERIRAMVTDTGAGFDPAEVGDERMGLKESVIARIAEVGGTARLFSSPGAGTTVIIEVPR